MASQWRRLQIGNKYAVGHGPWHGNKNDCGNKGKTQAHMIGNTYNSIYDQGHHMTGTTSLYPHFDSCCPALIMSRTILFSWRVRTRPRLSRVQSTSLASKSREAPSMGSKLTKTTGILCGRTRQLPN
jgi:hypothetical protein